VALWYARGGIVRLHTYGTDIYNVRTLNNHALCAGVIGVDSVDMGARAGTESVGIWQRRASPPANIGETGYG
jgi:hypothetical protein